MVPGIGYVDIAACIHSRPASPTEVVVVTAGDAGLALHPLSHAIAVQLQQTVAPLLDGDNVARTVHSDAAGRIEVIVVGEVGHTGGADGVQRHPHFYTGIFIVSSRIQVIAKDGHPG